MKLRVAVVVLSMAASACAARPATDTPASGAPPAPSDDMVSSEEPLDLDDAALRFEQAEQEIGTLLAEREETPDAAGPRPRGETEGQATPMAPPPDVASNRANRCSQACRALSSMKRSADRLCELAGGDDPRCRDVLARYERAGQRVREACAACGL